MKRKVSVSFLSSKNKEEDLIKLGATDTDYIHVDVMDGKFVKNKNFPFKLLDRLSYTLQKRLDVHLMVYDIYKGIEDFSVVEPNIVTFHYEACKDKEEVYQIIKSIKDIHAKVGISIKPDTKIEESTQAFNI